MTDFIDAEGFRANVGIVLIRDDRQVFLGGRTGGRGWQFPQGGVRRNEAPEEALYRELKEEIGLERADVELVAATRNWLRYRLPRQYVRTQQQSALHRSEAALVPAAASSAPRIACTSIPPMQPEFERWRWVDYWTPVREVIYFKRAVYARALDELAQRAFPDDPPGVAGMVGAGEESAQSGRDGEAGYALKARSGSRPRLQNGFTTTRITIAISSRPSAPR